jgi:hypothetical protein
VESFDPVAASRTIETALHGPGGAGVVLAVFDGVPGVVRTPAKRGLFRSAPERVRIGSWQYDLAPDGRVRAGHVVNDVVLAEELLGPEAAAAHLARALHEVVTSFGAGVTPRILAALEVLATAG